MICPVCGAVLSCKVCDTEDNREEVLPCGYVVCGNCNNKVDQTGLAGSDD